MFFCGERQHMLFATETTTTVITSISTKTASTTKASMPTTATTTPTTSTSGLESNKTPFTLIIVVSVFGGMFVIVIVLLVFLVVYWRPRSYQADGHHRWNHTHCTHNPRRERAEQGFYTAPNRLAGYSLYKGSVRNPVYEGNIVNMQHQNRYYRDTGNIFCGPEYDEYDTYQLGYRYADNWE